SVKLRGHRTKFALLQTDLIWQVLAFQRAQLKRRLPYQICLQKRKFRPVSSKLYRESVVEGY
ncbi:MAG: hypothetical protein AAFW75_19535, partial [Cyanobacteria bacterium J06636_16]